MVRSNIHRYPAWFIMMMIAAAAVLFLGAACGSGDDDDDSGNTSAATATRSTSGAASPTSGTPAMTFITPTTSMGTSGSPMTGEAGEITSCVQNGITGNVVNDLRSGDTATAEELFRGCLESNLPSSLAGQLDPIVQQAATCGETTSKELSDADVTAIEGGDQAAIQSFVQDTLQCVSDEFGIPIS